MATPAPVSLCTARRVSDALSALGLRAVAGLNATVGLLAPWGSVLHTQHDADESDALVAVVATADLQAWLEARVQSCACPDCGGAGRDEDHVVCAACHGAGDALEPVDAPDLDDAALDAGDRAADAARDAGGA